MRNAVPATQFRADRAPRGCERPTVLISSSESQCLRISAHNWTYMQLSLLASTVTPCSRANLGQRRTMKGNAGPIIWPLRAARVGKCACTVGHSTAMRRWCFHTAKGKWAAMKSGLQRVVRLAMPSNRARCRPGAYLEVVTEMVKPKGDKSCNHSISLDKTQLIRTRLLPACLGRCLGGR